jgi:putative FmdB family regulatory protein
VPTYDYVHTEATDCADFELRQNMSDDPVAVCPKCSLPVRRKIGKGAGVIFKGSGFYETDYKPRKKPPAGEES